VHGPRPSPHAVVAASEFVPADDGEIREGAVRDQPAGTVSERFRDHLTLAIIAANVAAVAAVLFSVFTLR
jgi:hypothetical protein